MHYSYGFFHISLTLVPYFRATLTIVSVFTMLHYFHLFTLFFPLHVFMVCFFPATPFTICFLHINLSPCWILSSSVIFSCRTIIFFFLHYFFLSHYFFLTLPYFPIQFLLCCTFSCCVFNSLHCSFHIF